MQNSGSFSENMRNGQLRPNAIEDNQVLSAIGAVRREAFVPVALQGAAYVDEDLPLGGGRYLLEPLIFATLVEKAAVLPGDRVLIIGGGFGYSAAVLSHLAAEITMVEENAEWVAQAKSRLAAEAVSRVTVVENALAEGWPAMQPYDVILVEGVVETLPAGLSAQLSEGGRLVTLECQSMRAGSQSAFSRYLLMRREGRQFPTRYEGDAFAYLLPAFRKVRPFVL